MKYMKFLRVLGLLLILVLFTSCEELDDFMPEDTSSSTTTESTIKFWKGIYGFEYPSSWDVVDTGDAGSSIIATFKEKKTGALIDITAVDLDNNVTEQDLLQFQEGVYTIKPYTITSQGLLPGSTMLAYETIFGDKYEQHRIVSFAVGKSRVDFSFSGPPESFDKINQGFNIVIKSFHTG